MKKKVVVGLILSMMVSLSIFNLSQSLSYIVSGDEVIEWHSYSEEELG